MTSMMFAGPPAIAALGPEEPRTIPPSPEGASGFESRRQSSFARSGNPDPGQADGPMQ